MITILSILAQAEVLIFLNVTSVDEADGKMQICPLITGRPNSVNFDENLVLMLITRDDTGILCNDDFTKQLLFYM